VECWPRPAAVSNLRRIEASVGRTRRMPRATRRGGLALREQDPVGRDGMSATAGGRVRPTPHRDSGRSHSAHAEGDATRGMALREQDPVDRDGMSATAGGRVQPTPHRNPVGRTRRMPRATRRGGWPSGNRIRWVEMECWPRPGCRVRPTPHRDPGRSHSAHAEGDATRGMALREQDPVGREGMSATAGGRVRPTPKRDSGRSHSAQPRATGRGGWPSGNRIRWVEMECRPRPVAVSDLRGSISHKKPGPRGAARVVAAALCRWL